MCHSDTFIFCNMIGVVIFITSHNYSTVLLSIFIVPCINWWVMYYLLQVCGLPRWH